MAETPTPPASTLAMRGVPDQTLFEVFHPGDPGSWFDKCRRLEVALIAAGWTPPATDEREAAKSSQQEGA